MKLQYCKPRKKLKNIFSFSTLWRISTVCKFQGPRELQKSGWAKSPILPHFSKKLSFIAFLCDNFFGFSKSGGAAAPLDPVDTRPLVGLKVQYCDFALKILKIKAENFWKWIQFLEAISYFSSSSLKTPFFCCRQAQAAVKVKFRQEFEIWGEVWWCKTYIVGTMLKIIKLLMPKLEAFFEALDMDPDHGSGEVRRVVMPHGSMKS